ncbi:MAG TPA: zinc ribbon domain-containing protein [Candidatus Eremiobacteraceae bacterium]|nr:zinc ribbon domain-containing protein [Candidatus Eremiobacteraceae bacterium]
MDHSCHKCGHSIEDGKPFCLQCGAPQIRVTLPEPPSPLVLAADGAVAAGDAEVEAVLPGITANALPESWSRDMKPCTLAAAIALVLTFLGLNPFVAALGTGLLAVVFSRRRGLGIVIRPAAGARLGAISGLLLFGMSTIFETLAFAFLHKGGELRNEMMDKIQQAAARYPGPEVQPFLDFAKSPGGFAFMMVASVIFGLLAFIALGSLGGALGARFMGRRGHT